MKCETCRGACCTSMVLHVSDLRLPGADARRWLELHATRTGNELSFECRCTALTPEGRCGIYATRPMACVLYKPGGPDCLATVRARRTPEQYAAIREAGDPLTIHGEAAA